MKAMKSMKIFIIKSSLSRLSFLRNNQIQLANKNFFHHEDRTPFLPSSHWYLSAAFELIILAFQGF